jgi:hypothetical protein
VIYETNKYNMCCIGACLKMEIKRIIRLIKEMKAESQAAGSKSSIEGEHLENAIDILSKNPKAQVPQHPRITNPETHNRIVNQARSIAKSFRSDRGTKTTKASRRAAYDFMKQKVSGKTTDIDVKGSGQTRRRQLKVATYNPSTFYSSIHSIAKNSPGYSNLNIDFEKNPEHRNFKNLHTVLQHIENHPHLKSKNESERTTADSTRRKLRGFFAKIPSERLDDANYKSKLISVRPTKEGKVKVEVVDKKEHIDAPDENFKKTTSGLGSLSFGRFRFSQDRGNINVHLRHQHPPKK